MTFENVSVAEGKYTVQIGVGIDAGQLKALRHGEPWQDLCGNNLVYWLAVELRNARVGQWLPIETAPKDGAKILGLCVHEADPYCEDGMLTPYAARAEGMAHVANGSHVLVWDEAFEENDGPESQSYTVPGWWTLASDNEVAANPTHYVLLPGALE